MATKYLTRRQKTRGNKHSKKYVNISVDWKTPKNPKKLIKTGLYHSQQKLEPKKANTKYRLIPVNEQRRYNTISKIITRKGVPRAAENARPHQSIRCNDEAYGGGEHNPL